MASTFTDGDGYYSFIGLNAGDYFIQIDGMTLPKNGDFTVQNAPGSTPENDSDVDAGTSISPNFSLTQYQADANRDVGVAVTASLGDFVWIDADWHRFVKKTALKNAIPKRACPPKIPSATFAADGTTNRQIQALSEPRFRRCPLAAKHF